MYFVYVLKSKSARKSYVGYTEDLDRRIIQHNSGHNLFSKRFMPWEIVYTEKYDNIVDAIAREKYLKTTSGRRF
jgi:putative endonuclease